LKVENGVGVGGGGVEERVALEGNVIVADAGDGAEAGGDVEDILRMEGVRLDDDARGLLEARRGGP
jgi:hypothetical protein